MWLSGTLLGLSTFFSGSPAPSPSTYNKITFYGDITIDNVWIKSRILTDAEIDAIDIAVTPTWTTDTILLATFDNNLDGGNIKNLTSPIVSWDVYRRNIDNNILKKLTTLDVGTRYYVDWTTQAYISYEYEVFPITSTEIGAPLVSDSFYTDYYGYYLIDESLGISYKFDFQLASGDVQYQEDCTEYSTYTKYLAIAKGKRNYQKTSITVMAGTIKCSDGTFLQPMDYIQEVEDFIANSNVKIWKTRKGDIRKVITRNFQFKQLDDAIPNQPALITFDIVEIEAVD